MVGIACSVMHKLYITAMDGRQLDGHTWLCFCQIVTECNNPLSHPLELPKQNALSTTADNIASCSYSKPRMCASKACRPVALRTGLEPRQHFARLHTVDRRAARWSFREHPPLHRRRQNCRVRHPKQKQRFPDRWDHLRNGLGNTEQLGSSRY